MQQFTTTYQKLTNNLDKFDILEDRIEQGYEFTLSDFQFLLQENIEVVFYFIEEYDFEELTPEKRILCQNFVLQTINKVDKENSLQLMDLLAFCEKIQYWQIFEAYIQSLDLTEYTSIFQYTYLDFILDNLKEFDTSKVLDFVLQQQLTATISQLLLQYLLFKIDTDKYKAAFQGFIEKHKDCEAVQGRLVNMGIIKKLPLPLK